ncbi:MAG TPA: toast rack family protein [Anaerolineaceae bacterium]|nr:toast rack family protein [Anaerolineaceae bacterium]
MKRPLLFALIVLVIASLACSFTVNLPEAQRPGPTQTLTVNEAPFGPGATTQVKIEMGAGTLKLAGNADGLVQGTVEYNIDKWKPTVTRQDNTLEIKQSTLDNVRIGNDIQNDWNLKFSSTVPMNLSVSAGAYDGNLDLSGLHLRKLDISDGASKSRVTFTSANPEVLSDFHYKTGASQVEMEGLGNANFEQLTFDSGAGNYTLDFTGKLKRDGKVTIHSGVSQITIMIPEGMKASIQTNGGLNNVETNGTWTTEGSNYSTGGEGPEVTIQIDMGVGNLKLIHK